MGLLRAVLEALYLSSRPSAKFSWTLAVLIVHFPSRLNSVGCLTLDHGNYNNSNLYMELVMCQAVFQVFFMHIN